jgi:hypothetical protein
MARRSFVQVNGKLYERGVDDIPDVAGMGSGRAGTHTVMGDLPDFVSPIDGQLVSGRAGLREHCKKHGVVPTADLKGLPFKQAVQEYQPDRAGIRDAIRRAVYK